MSDTQKTPAAEFVVKSKVRELFREADMKASADVMDELGYRVTRAVKHAIARAKANGRKTVKAHDV